MTKKTKEKKRYAHSFNGRMILSLLPATSAEVKERSGLANSTVDAYLKKMHEDGDIHISAWIKAEGRGRSAMQYAEGFGKDVEFIRTKKTEADRIRKKDMQRRKYALRRVWKQSETCNSFGNYDDTENLESIPVRTTTQQAILSRPALALCWF